MPDRLSSAQIRGARGMLDWSMVDLAEAARMSVSTIKRIESGVPQPISDRAFDVIRGVLETEGIEILSDRGGGSWLRLRKS